MNPLRRILAMSILASGLLFPATAQISMSRRVVASGGGPASNAAYTLQCTLGQTVIGIMGGPSYVIGSGFWCQAGEDPASAPEAPPDLPGTPPPTEFGLGGLCASPLAPTATLQFAVAARAHVVIRLYDVSGRTVRTLQDGELDPGYHRTAVCAAGLPSGVYFCRMTAGRFAETRRLVLAK